MTDVKLKIGVDQAAIKAGTEQGAKLIAERLTDAGEKAAKATTEAYKESAEDIEKKLADAVGKASEHAVKGMDKVFGGDFAKKIGPENLKAAFNKGLTELVKDQKFKDSTKRVGDSMALSIGKQLGVKLDTKAIQKVVASGITEAEREATKAATAGARPGVHMGGAAAADLERHGGGGGGGGRHEEEHEKRGFLAWLKEKLPSPGMAALAAGGGLLAGMVGAFRGEHQATLRMAPTMGVGRAFGALEAGNNMLLSREETVGAMTGAAQRGVGTRDAVLRATRHGLGGELSGLLGARAAATGERFEAGTFRERGGRVKVEIDKIETKAQREFQRVIGLGFATGLERGRRGELFAGLTEMQAGRGLGQGVSGDAISAMLMKAGGAGMRGTAGFQAVQGAESLLRSPGTGLGQAIGLRTVGFGQAGGPGYFTAKAAMRKGLFGEGITPEEAQRRGEALTQGYRQTFGFKGKLGEKAGTPDEEERRQMTLAHAAEAAGMAPEEMEKVFSVLEKSNVTQEELKKLQQDGMSVEEKQSRELVGISKTARGIELAIEGIFNKLSASLEPAVGYLADIAGSLRDATHHGVGETMKHWMGFGHEDVEAQQDKMMHGATDVMRGELAGQFGGFADERLRKGTAERFSAMIDADSMDAASKKKYMQIEKFFEKTGSLPQAGGKTGLSESFIQNAIRMFMQAADDQAKAAADQKIAADTVKRASSGRQSAGGHGSHATPNSGAAEFANVSGGHGVGARGP